MHFHEWENFLKQKNHVASQKYYFWCEFSHLLGITVKISN